MSEQNKNSDPHQTPLQLWTQPPENYYRSRSSISLHNPSPADSQTPIMANSGSWPIQQAEASSSSHAQPYNEPIYPPPPPLPNYRTSMNVVNGEVGAVPAPNTNTTEQWANVPIPPLSAPLKTSGTTAEELRVAELDKKAQDEDKKDLAIKLKVRLAKVVLRSINCACSLVVLALVASTFAIFNATRYLAPRIPPGSNKELRPWSATTPTWPQITILVIACISLVLSLFIMFSYWKGGHNRAERVALHATIFAGAVFILTIAMWSTGIGIMQGSRAGNDDQDLWGWACKDNQRRKLFEDSINYRLVCRQQDWVVVCAIIEISVEFLAICVYIFAFYRIFHTKRKLRKSLMVRDEARSSLWLAKLKEQKEAEADPETQKNTSYNQAYNQLNTNTANNNINDAEEGRSEYRPVPKLQPAPLSRHKVHQSDASDAPLQPPAAFFRSNTNDLPPTPRSVSFSQQPGTPGIAR